MTALKIRLKQNTDEYPTALAVSALAALGGKQNLKHVGACSTRLRLETVATV